MHWIQSWLYVNASTLLTEWHRLCGWIPVNSGTFGDSVVKPPQYTFSPAAFSDGFNRTPNPQWVSNVPSGWVKILSVATMHHAIDLHSTLLFHHQASLSMPTPVQNWIHKFPKQSGLKKNSHVKWELMRVFSNIRDHVYFVQPLTNVSVNVLTDAWPTYVPIYQPRHQLSSGRHIDRLSADILVDIAADIPPIRWLLIVGGILVDCWWYISWLSYNVSQMFGLSVSDVCYTHYFLFWSTSKISEVC